MPETTCPGLQENVLTCLVELYVGLRWTRIVGRPVASGRGTVVTSKFARILRTARVSPEKREPVTVCGTHGAVHMQAHRLWGVGPLVGLTFVTRRAFCDILVTSRKLPVEKRRLEIDLFFRLPQPKWGD